MNKLTSDLGKSALRQASNLKLLAAEICAT